MAEHPIVEVLRKDREKVDSQATSVLKDYHTTITYLGAGALGFFLTIHEKFFQIQSANLMWLFLTSLSLLFLSLLLYLVNIIGEYFLASSLRDQMDKYIGDVDFNNTSQEDNDKAEQVLLTQWEKGERTARRLMFFRLLLVVLGIGFEVVFIACNISLTKTKEDKSTKIQIELEVDTKGTTIIVDTTSNRSLNIKF